MWIACQRFRDYSFGGCNRVSSPNHHFAGVRAFPGKAVGRAFFVLGLYLFLLRGAAGQEALRASLAGEYAVEAQKRATANQYYNLKMGDLKLRFQAAFGVEATDNVNYTEKNRQADISLRPQLDVTAMLPVTDKNTLALTIGAGYAKYAKTKARDHFFLTPDSRLAFNIYAGDFVFDLHTQFTYTQQSYQQTEIYGGNYGYFENVTGVTATWDLGKLIFTFGIDHEIYSPTDKQYDYQSRASELFSARGVVLLNPTTQLGLQAGFSLTEFDLKPGYDTKGAPAYTFLSNQKSINFGPYFQSRLSAHLRTTLSAGYAIYFQEYESSFGKAGDSAAFYADLQVQHTVNARVNYSLNLGHQVRQGLTTDTLDYYYFRLNPSWRVFDNLTLTAPLSWESTTIARRNEEYQYWNLGLVASYRLSRQLNVSGGYYYRRRDSNVTGGSYLENQLVFNTRYSF